MNTRRMHIETSLHEVLPTGKDKRSSTLEKHLGLWLNRKIMYHIQRFLLCTSIKVL